MKSIYYLVVSSLISISLHASKQPIPLIEKVNVTKNRVEITINKDFKKAYLKSDFFVEYDKDVDLTKFDYSITTLPFIMNVISLVWISGKDYQVDSMDAEIYESLERIKKIFKVMYPKTTWNGRLIPQKFVTHPAHRYAKPAPQDTMALLFSGGLDSTVSSLYHRDKPQVLVTAWGQSALPLTEQKLWEKVKKRLTSFAHKYGHENAFLKSNYYYFLDLKKLSKLSPEIVWWRTDTIEDIGWAGLIAPILLSRGISTLRIGASEHWAVPIGSAASPYIDSTIRFAGIKIYHDLFSMCRFDKIAYMVDLCNQGLIEKPNLIICQKPGNIISCGKCEKCCLTLALLLGADADPREYGFPLTPEQASKRVQKHLSKQNSFMVTTLWEYNALQKKVQENPNKQLMWLGEFDLSQKKAATLKEDSQTLDWAELDALFPHVRGEAN